MSRKFKPTRTELSWILYDVGNSVFVLVMVTALMPLYFKDVVAVQLSGVESTASWGYANSAASLLLAFLSPVLGAMADYQGRKKGFLLFFLGVGLAFTLSLVIIGENQWLLCLVLFVIARVGWSGANIFYDAFLVDVTTAERMDRVSSMGYGYGYVGSVVPFLVIIGLIFSAGIGGGLPPLQTKVGFVIVALWWFVLSLPAIKNLQQIHHIPPEPAPVRASLKRVWRTFKEIRSYNQVFLFLMAYFFYIDGVGTIISMSTVYGRDLGFSPTMLLVVLLFIQLVAFPFTLYFGRLAGSVGVKNMLYVGIGIYCIATLLGFLLPDIANPGLKSVLFWTIALLIASSMGGIQALSRSYFARLIPAARSAEFFGFYNVFGKFAAISGPFLMAMVASLTGESRWGLLSILLLFVVGATLLSRVEEEKG